MEHFHRFLKAHVKAQQADAKEALRRKPFHFEKSVSETNIVGIANATGAMEKRLGGSLDVALPAEKSLRNH